jgi:CrcB protein
MEHRAVIMVVMIGAYLTLSGLYLILFLIEHGFSFDTHLNLMVSVFITNGFICVLVLWMGLLAGEQI